MWTCPACDRKFGAVGRSHRCVPTMSRREWLAERPPQFGPICDAVIDHLRELGDIEVEWVGVGVLIKRSSTFVELRPRRDRKRRDRLVLSFLLPRRVEHPRIKRVYEYASSGVHHVDLYDIEDVDDDVREWLTESYDSSPTRSG